MACQLLYNISMRPPASFKPTQHLLISPTTHAPQSHFSGAEWHQHSFGMLFLHSILGLLGTARAILALAALSRALHIRCHAGI